ncbi:helicase-related protein [Pseudonocardia sp. CA-142604]|uniref:helicase-related protein n=1 Tax=Pseudonocardia sp. CA-142604 TaxID=3240024 RepID=UPI003D946990
MPDLAAHYVFRDELVDRFRADVLGPVEGEDEILTEEPATAYITGVLYPRDRGRGPTRERKDAEDIDLTPVSTSSDEVPETGVAMANRQMPSAAGITFAVDPSVTSIVSVSVSAAVYEPHDAMGRVVSPQRAERRGTDDDSIRWHRRAFTATPVTVSVIEPNASASVDIGEGLVVRLRVRPADDDGVIAVTVTLVNDRTADPSVLIDRDCVFQPEIRVEVPGGGPGLVERPAPTTVDEEDLELSAMLHRHAPLFAVGHGCTAMWDLTPPAFRGPRSPTRARTNAVWTSFVPDRDVLLTESNPEVTEPGMLELAEASTADLVDTLRRMLDGYRGWIEERTADAVPLRGSRFETAADRQMQACAEACDRMRDGVGLLEQNEQVLAAFRLACSAMADQRARTIWIRSKRAAALDPAAGRWRPFQIGFILLCLSGVVDAEHPDRNLADLLWFPTGGGKTEAYLGLIAFTTFLRRLRRRAAGAGVTVLMRYTLRLLTLQQFERAATLICAMETIRRTHPEDLGTEPISIGMWVGAAATPNRLDDAHHSIEELRAGRTVREKNPVQLTACPWCGTPMDHANYHVDRAAGRMMIRCRDSGCEFHTGLPVHVVDEDIYAVRPTLVIATADKFAQIAWRSDVAKLFNRDGAPAGTPPPELVIQDELHLISGPLGTLAGLYETAIDIAADRPKVVASTATIRRAQQQGARLFDREVRQFPPAGIDSRDSWFAVEAPRTAKASRCYAGVLAPATSQATLLIRVYSALLHHAARIAGDDAVRDTYWTLVGYFNSLRLLSAAELQAHADVQERLARLSKRDGVDGRRIDNLTELTSRIDSSDIPSRLAWLFVAHPRPEAFDVVLATNMISVGVDVDRLGLMAIMGQPQTTAEYIQATSRVGRRDPGLVVTMLNASRSRDRSHYESFLAYHSALYRQVESTSVTPFAARARDRALHAVFVGLLRILHPIARPNDAAGRVETFLGELDMVRAAVLDRVEAVSPTERKNVDVELDDFIEHWRDMAASNPQLVYESRRHIGSRQRGPDTALLRSFGQDDDLEQAYDTMWSLRDVDVESDLYPER